MRILVCGDRNWRNREFIEFILCSVIHQSEYIQDDFKNTTIIHGAASGADSIANKIAEERNIKTNSFPVTTDDWNRLGKAAGPIRNKRMINEGNPDIVLAFYNDISKSKGTLDMIKQANRAGIEVRLYSDGGVT